MPHPVPPRPAALPVRAGRTGLPVVAARRKRRPERSARRGCPWRLPARAVRCRRRRGRKRRTRAVSEAADRPRRCVACRPRRAASGEGHPHCGRASLPCFARPRPEGLQTVAARPLGSWCGPPWLSAGIAGFAGTTCRAGPREPSSSRLPVTARACPARAEPGRPQGENHRPARGRWHFRGRTPGRRPRPYRDGVDGRLRRRDEDSDLLRQLRRRTRVARRREGEQPRLRLLRNRRRADELVQPFAMPALAARELLQLLVGAVMPCAASRSAPPRRALPSSRRDPRRCARGSASSLSRPRGTTSYASRLWPERHADVAQHGRIGEVALPARDRQLLRQVAQQRVGDAQVALGVLEVDRVHLVRHRRGADLAGLQPSGGSSRARYNPRRRGRGR